MADHTVTVYSTPTCPWCDRAKAYLKEIGVSYTEKDVSRDISAAQEMTKLSGQMGVPVLNIDGKIVVGFDKRKIDAYLGQ